MESIREQLAGALWAHGFYLLASFTVLPTLPSLPRFIWISVLEIGRELSPSRRRAPTAYCLAILKAQCLRK